ncbi:MAG: hypothetical protein L3K17_08405 [Thermoplasmata archaeon]|nr:hypothetical protein [Thermoplasmata archaeon]
MLQAARAKSLGLPRDAAFSWGLNRAIFYAAAKQGFRGGSSDVEEAPKATARSPSREVYRLGDDEAFRDPNAPGITFVIGDRAQTPEEFERAVTSRFTNPENFHAAWEEAMHVVGEFDRATLESRQRFYDEVYRPRRDRLSDEWTEKYSPPPRSKKSDSARAEPRSSSSR